jgi:hypothetical protein
MSNIEKHLRDKRRKFLKKSSLSDERLKERKQKVEIKIC